MIHHVSEPTGFRPGLGTLLRNQPEPKSVAGDVFADLEALI